MAAKDHFGVMKHTLTFLAITMALTFGSAAHADCYADYKAKRDNPLQLHYGVAQISGACTKANAEVQLKPRVAVDGWKLLNVVSVFEEDGLSERSDSAGKFYLRY